MSFISRVRRKLAGAQPAVERFEGTFPFFNVLDLMVRHVADIDNVRFLQIGAADGCTEDPISEMITRHGWSGTLVEPSPRSFRQLQETYKGQDNLRFEQCLVTDFDETSEEVLYEVAENIRDISHWAEQSSSMDRDVVYGFLYYLSTTDQAKHLPKDLNTAIEETKVPSYPMAELIRRLEITELDVLVIDTMGHDAKLLQVFPFDVVKPKLIMFEHFVITPSEKAAVLRTLANAGYSFVKFAVDTIAVLDDQPRQWTVTEW